MLVPDARRVVHCGRCGLPVDTRVARYVFLLVADRGRGGRSVLPDIRRALCGPCGNSVRELLEQNGVLVRTEHQERTGLAGRLPLLQWTQELEFDDVGSGAGLTLDRDGSGVIGE
jgi:hypothetical protein